MDFARKQLEKYGWTDGKGLGKHENGIAEALKPKLKRSVAGVGHDLASDFTEHWWSALYDKAAGNVQVEEKNGKTKKIKTKETQFQITNSTWRINKKQKDSNEQEEYAEYFVKKAVLTNGGSKVEKVKESESEDEIDEKEKKEVLKMTDEELFAACGGRTAHKGARHGLKASGKLARIERQEQMLLVQPQYNGYSHSKKAKKEKLSVCDLVVEDMNLNSDVDTVKTKRKKKKRDCSSNSENSGKEYQFSDKDLAECSAPLLEEAETAKRTKKSKRKNVDCNDEANDCTIIIKSKKKKKASKFCDSDINESQVETHIEPIEFNPGHIKETEKPSKKNKKKKLRTNRT